MEYPAFKSKIALALIVVEGDIKIRYL